jgi:hypothetical protein
MGDVATPFGKYASAVPPAAPFTQQKIDPRAMGGAKIEQKENPALAGLKSKTQIATCGRYSPSASV